MQLNELKFIIRKLVRETLFELNTNYLYKNTPKIFKYRAQKITSKLITIKKGKYFYKTVTSPSGNVYSQWIKPQVPNMEIKDLNTDVIMFCNCNNFKYENEYTLWKNNASHIVNSNGKFPRVRNPRMIKKVCKHLLSDIDDLKKRL